jgi:HCOMODA/2-hydroxy-3-carboxy-muconic semialdehyde decarboxylase
VKLRAARRAARPKPNKGTRPVPDALADIRREIAIANRILANEGVLDAFGHVSARHPTDPGRYLLSRSRSPLLIEPADVLEYTLDSEPVKPASALLYAERVIHGCIYQARPDVMAVCHHHAPAIMPFCVAGVPLLPVFHLGAAIGEYVPFWDQHDEFGATNLLVVKPEEGRSLARTLGKHSAVLMDRHGATVVGGGIRELVSRSIFMCQNADYQLRARALGSPNVLHAGEVKLAGTISMMPNVVTRTWEFWSMRLAMTGRMPAVAATRKAPKRASAARRRARPARKTPKRR